MEKIAADGVSMDFYLVPWDSEIFGHPVAEITDLQISRVGKPAAAFEAFQAWCDDQQVRLVTCRLHHNRLRESMFLEDNGFRFIEMVFSPRLADLNRIDFPESGISLTSADSADLAEVEQIAGSAFVTGRYLLDWRLDPELSHRRYRAWVRNSFADSRHSLVKASLNGEIIGFFIVEKKPDGGCYWHLTAVSPSWQGKGIGKRLWQTVMIKHKNEGAAYIETTVSAHNIAVLNLYGRLGFEFRLPRMTFHWIQH